MGALSPPGERARLTLLLVGVGFLGPPPAYAQYSVDPVIVQLAAGDTAETRALEIRNEGSRPLPLRLYAMDFEQGPTGKHTYLRPGEHERSCRERLRVTPEAISVPPHSSRLVSVHMAPASSNRSCWSVVFVERPARARSGVYVNLRIGVKVYGLAGSPSLDGEIADATVEAQSPAPLLSFSFRNEGDWPLRPEGEVQIRSFDGALVDTLVVDAFSVLPQHTRELRLDLPASLEKGRYLAIPILDFGGDYLTGSQVAFRVP